MLTDRVVEITDAIRAKEITEKEFTTALATLSADELQRIVQQARDRALEVCDEPECVSAP